MNMLNVSDAAGSSKHVPNLIYGALGDAKEKANRY